MSNRSLKIQLHKEDPRCYWCKRETILTNVKHIKGKPEPLMATIDHLISKLNPERWVKKTDGERRKVLACFECNNNRSSQELSSLSREELYERGQGYCLNLNSVIEKPLDTVEEVRKIVAESREGFIVNLGKSIERNRALVECNSQISSIFAERIEKNKEVLKEAKLRLEYLDEVLKK